VGHGLGTPISCEEEEQQQQQRAFENRGTRRILWPQMEEKNKLRKLHNKNYAMCILY
jgi:hypothetical protein